MAKKKLSSLNDLGGFAFSTNKDFKEFEEEKQPTLLPKQQNLEALFSKKGRGGKIVTIIRGFIGTDVDLKTLAKLLKTKCGVGGSVKDNEIIVQGNYRDKIMQILKDKGYNVKRIGG